MSPVRWFIIQFGVFAVLAALLLCRQILRHELVWMKHRRSKFASPEGVVLLGAAALTAIRYLVKLYGTADKTKLPRIEIEWLVAFGAGCLLYLGVKAFRMLRSRAT